MIFDPNWGKSIVHLNFISVCTRPTPKSVITIYNTFRVFLYLWMCICRVFAVGDTVLDFMEFVELYLAYESEFQDVLNDLKVAFEVMDTDQSGYLSPDELKLVQKKKAVPDL